MSRVLEIVGRNVESQTPNLTRDRFEFPGRGASAVGLVSHVTTGSFSATIFGRNLPSIGDFIDSSQSARVTGISTTGSIDGGLTLLARVTHSPADQQVRSVGNPAYFTGSQKQTISGLVRLNTTGTTTIGVMHPVSIGVTAGKVITCFGPAGSGIEFTTLVTSNFTETAGSWAGSYHNDPVTGYYQGTILTPVPRTSAGVCAFILTDPAISQDPTFTSRRVAPNAPRFG